ncbi:5-formyltetrahydrofolate cyclo-ligase [Parvibaculum sp.]|jgi:5-formyltetrahydrofolate cyclo-ligase|uniref:5-formyltetrahydrofolate cyclo-ligase n=1 Tax=Parvibaculum sp. TaxID=2024848 RepID=UPI001B0A66CC|nr:5-formyltetrahydrofolate cyclo-ligase [Parvibaculum sp.]MBO6633808.1 5-formyltetrahydrofolate cyclo-ligase [Parvibaculum sp.]MBO6679486.1 5-formyltetrahydrofolate cyclo-ligase [Parvibaculum sp.]MBO6684930.1 5-formyltetrahydrofolate cyclo-ligase [Parvibaculum sp.]MBO6904506.1 5-formyltetrahydrofolate cyclo-ligase [Parvibaculum sp.]
MSADAKNHARAVARERRDAAHLALGVEGASRIADHFLSAIPLEPTDCIAGYVAFGSEADPSELLSRLSVAGYSCALPRVAVRNRPLTFKCWRPGDPLIGGLHGTREPLPDALDCRPDIVVVPLLAFDAEGRRLGYGGGYYDRTLATLRAEGRRILAVGVAFSAQEAQDLPEDKFDERLDWVVTEADARPIGSAAGR